MTEINNLPSGWKRVKLGNISEPSKEKVNPQDVPGVPYIGLEHIEKETGRLLGYGNSTEVKSTKNVFHPGDLLYGKLRPYLNKVYVPDFKGICSTDILVFPRNESYSNKFLYYRFLSGDFVRFASQNVSGVQHPRVSPTTLAEFEIDIPPLPEQDRIVAKIEELFTQLDAGVAELRAAKAQLKRYRQAVLKAAVEGELTREWRETHRNELEPAGQLLARILSERRAKWEGGGGKGKYKEPVTPDIDGLPELPKGWVWGTVNQMGEIKLGRQRAPKYHNGPHMRPYLRVANVFEDRIDLSDVKMMNFSPTEYEIYKLEYGDVLLNEGQSPELLGRSAIYRNEVPGACFQNTLIRFRAYEGVLPNYALSVFRHCMHSGRFVKESRITTNIAHLSAGRLSTVEFPLPPTEEQKVIMQKVERRMSVADEIESELDQALARSERLRQSILKRAFEGRLV